MENYYCATNILSKINTPTHIWVYMNVYTHIYVYIVLSYKWPLSAGFRDKMHTWFRFRKFHGPYIFVTQFHPDNHSRGWTFSFVAMVFNETTGLHPRVQQNTKSSRRIRTIVNQKNVQPMQLDRFRITLKTYLFNCTRGFHYFFFFNAIPPSYKFQIVNRVY